MKSILHREFIYVPAEQMGADYLRKKFAKLIRESKEQARVRAGKVTPIKQVAK